MAELGLRTGNAGPGSGAVSLLDRLTDALEAAGPPLLFGLRLWAAVCLALYIAFWLELDNAYWAGTTAAIVCQPSLGASIRKSWYRMVGTLVGAVVIVALTACFPQDRAPFLLSLALWGGACAFAATVLRNFAAYSAALAGYTAAIIASDQLGATGGLNGNAFLLAVTRVSEIGLGIVSAGIVLGATDLGKARHRLTILFAALSADIASHFTSTLTEAGGEFSEIREVRRNLLQRVIALDPVIDEAFGESFELRYRSAVLQAAADGLFIALGGWRSVAVRLFQLPREQARGEAALVLSQVPPELRSVAEDRPAGEGAAARLREVAENAVRRLASLPTDTPSVRLLAAQSAEVLGGIARAFNGLALLMGDTASPVRHRRGFHVPDWLPSVINGARAFVMIGLAALFWIVTAWPNGAAAITWVAIVVILFAPRAEQAFAISFEFTVGNCIAAAGAAIIGFAVLPRLENFVGLSLAIGAYLVPVGALMATSWRPVMFTAMTANLIPLLAPANQMSYDTLQFYNSSVAIVAGGSMAALSFSLLPSLSPSFRARRLLAFTLRDLQRLATGRTIGTVDDWRGLVFQRLAVMPNEASQLQRAQLLSALSVGAQITQLRHVARRLDFEASVDRALEGFARGDSGITIGRLGELDRLLASRRGAERAHLRARSLILAISEALAQHCAYFDTGSSA